MTLGDKIQKLRMQKNMSQEQLAHGMNLSMQTITEWETGAITPEVSHIVALSKLLNVSTDYLLKEPTTPSVQAAQTSPFDIRIGHWAGDDEYEDDEDFVDIREHIEFTGNFHLDLSKAIYPIAVLIYLFIGFVHGLWHPGWVVFVGAWILEELVGFIKTGKVRISVYGVAAAIYIVLGIFFVTWSTALLVFVVAWIIDEVVVLDKPGKKKKKRRNDEW